MSAAPPAVTPELPLPIGERTAEIRRFAFGVLTVVLLFVVWR